jgi:hypothetical protein
MTQGLTQSLLAAPFLTSLFFWTRGLYKGCRGDLVLGALLFLLSAFGALAVIGDFGLTGGFLLLTGLTTILLCAHAEKNKLCSRSTAEILGALLVVIGILSALIV